MIRFSLLGAACLLLPFSALAQSAPTPIPDIHSLMLEVRAHQKAIDKRLSDYTYSSNQVTRELDNKGRVTKTETRDYDVFFVHGRRVARLTKKEGQPLSESEDKKEIERVTKASEKAEKTGEKADNEEENSGKSNETLSLSEVLDNVEITNPRRENYHGRPTLVYDFQGRKGAHAKDTAQEVAKKLKGTVWIDETDRVVAHLDVTLTDNFRVAGGLAASIQRGTHFAFEQSPIHDVWMQTGVDATFEARLLLVKSVRQQFSERDTNFQRYHVDAEQTKDVKITKAK